MDSDSFRGRIVLSLVDKVVIGVVASMILLFFSAKQDERTRLRDQAIAVSTVQTEVLLQDRHNIIEAVRGCLAIADEAVMNKDISNEELLEVERLESMVKITLLNLLAMDTSVVVQCESLEHSVENLDRCLKSLALSAEKDVSQIEAARDALRKKHVVFLSVLRDMSRRAIRKEISGGG